MSLGSHSSSKMHWSEPEEVTIQPDNQHIEIMAT